MQTRIIPNFHSLSGLCLSAQISNMCGCLDFIIIVNLFMRFLDIW